jgi:light-regulated signal transduction histidine kinase (bacteriophytochrome)
VRADGVELQQVLLNLLSNASKFTEARDGRKGRLGVTCATDPAPSDRVVLRVRDTGIGIRRRRVPAPQRLGAGERLREYVGVVRGADVPGHHGRMALEHRQLGARHRRAAERRAVRIGVRR